VRVVGLDPQYKVSGIPVVRIVLETEQGGPGGAAVSHGEVSSVGSVLHDQSGLGVSSPSPVMHPAAS